MQHSRAKLPWLTTVTILSCCVSPHPNHQANFVKLLEHLDALSSLNPSEAATVENSRTAPSYQQARAMLATDREYHTKAGWPIRHVTIRASKPCESNLRIAHPLFREFTPDYRWYWQGYLDTWSNILMFYIDFTETTPTWDTLVPRRTPIAANCPTRRVNSPESAGITRVLERVTRILPSKFLRVVAVVKVAEKRCEEHGRWLSVEQEQVLRDLDTLPAKSKLTLMVIDGSDGDLSALLDILQDLAREGKAQKFREQGTQIIRVGRRGRAKLRLRRLYTEMRS